MIGIDLDNKLMCVFCAELFDKGTGHLMFCADCAINGRPDKHPVCDICYHIAVEKGIVKPANYKLGDYADSLKEKFK